MRIVERMPLGQKSSLCIVKVLDKYYLMSCTEQHNEIIKELEIVEADIAQPQNGLPQLQKESPFWEELSRQVKGRGQNIG